MPVMNVASFERFFRVAAGLNVDKEDLRRYSDFARRKLYDLLLRAQAIIEPFDLPITKGLQESMHAFKALDEQLELRTILQELAREPPLDLAYADQTTARLPEVVGGLSVALARSFKVLDPHLKNPQAAHRETVFRLFDVLL